MLQEADFEAGGKTKGEHVGVKHVYPKWLVDWEYPLPLEGALEKGHVVIHRGTGGDPSASLCPGFQDVSEKMEPGGSVVILSSCQTFSFQLFDLTCVEERWCFRMPAVSRLWQRGRSGWQRSKKQILYSFEQVIFGMWRGHILKVEQKIPYQYRSSICVLYDDILKVRLSAAAIVLHNLTWIRNVELRCHENSVQLTGFPRKVTEQSCCRYAWTSANISCSADSQRGSGQIRSFWNPPWGLTSFFTPLIDIINSYRGDVGHPRQSFVHWFSTWFVWFLDDFGTQWHEFHTYGTQIWSVFLFSRPFSRPPEWRDLVRSRCFLIEVIKFSGDALTIYFQAEKYSWIHGFSWA